MDIMKLSKLMDSVDSDPFLIDEQLGCLGGELLSYDEMEALGLNRKEMDIIFDVVELNFREDYHKYYKDLDENLLEDYVNEHLSSYFFYIRIYDKKPTEEQVKSMWTSEKWHDAFKLENGNIALYGLASF